MLRGIIESGGAAMIALALIALVFILAFAFFPLAWKFIAVWLIGKDGLPCGKDDDEAPTVPADFFD